MFQITCTNRLSLLIIVLEMEFGLFDVGDDGEHSSSGLAEISKIFARQDEFFDGAVPFLTEYRQRGMAVFNLSLSRKPT